MYENNRFFHERSLVSKYSSFFILPNGSTKVLTQEGWYFYTEDGLSLEIYKLLKVAFTGVEKERENEFFVFSSNSLEFTFNLVGDKVVEIFIKVYRADDLPGLKEKIQEIKRNIDFEIFDPNFIFK